MQWRDAQNGGFTRYALDQRHPNFHSINAEAALSDATSVFHHYRKLIELRKTHDVIAYGAFQSYLDAHRMSSSTHDLIMDETITVVANFSSTASNWNCPMS